MSQEEFGSNRVQIEAPELPYEINEELKLLRTNLQFCGTDKKVICITSAVASEGKSTTVLNLCPSARQERPCCSSTPTCGVRS